MADVISEVERVAGLPDPEAERAVRATLETLAERLTGGQARDIAPFVPPELQPVLTSAPEPAEPLSLGEFLRRVAEREGVGKSTASDHVRAVFAALGRVVPSRELRDMAAQLPKEFDPLLEVAGVRRDGTLPADRLIDRVAELTGLDEDRARRATEAVLETLAVRISAGELHDVIDELPADLVPALERGLAESREATRMSADEFVARVAEREGVSVQEAREHAQAVFAALREVITANEFSDMADQLSAGYEPLLA
jgi:uncharacterized protein (DUF2267 family)